MELDQFPSKESVNLGERFCSNLADFIRALFLNFLQTLPMLRRTAFPRQLNGNQWRVEKSGRGEENFKNILVAFSNSLYF